MSAWSAPCSSRLMTTRSRVTENQPRGVARSKTNPLADCSSSSKPIRPRAGAKVSSAARRVRARRAGATTCRMNGRIPGSPTDIGAPASALSPGDSSGRSATRPRSSGIVSARIAKPTLRSSSATGILPATQCARSCAVIVLRSESDARVTPWRPHPRVPSWTMTVTRTMGKPPTKQRGHPDAGEPAAGGDRFTSMRMAAAAACSHHAAPPAMRARARMRFRPGVSRRTFWKPQSYRWLNSSTPGTTRQAIVR